MEEYPKFYFSWLFTGDEKAMENNGNVVVGENNGTMQVNHSTSPEVLAEQVKASEEQLKRKDEIISLLKK